MKTLLVCLLLQGQWFKIIKEKQLFLWRWKNRTKAIIVVNKNRQNNKINQSDVEARVSQSGSGSKPITERSKPKVDAVIVNSVLMRFICWKLFQVSQNNLTEDSFLFDIWAGRLFFYSPRCAYFHKKENIVPVHV